MPSPAPSRPISTRSRVWRPSCLPPASTWSASGGDLGKVAEVYQVNAFVLSSVAVQAERLALTVQLVEPEPADVNREYEGTRTGYLNLVRKQPRAFAGGQADRFAGGHREQRLGGGAGVAAGRYHLSRYGALYKTEDADLAMAAFQRCSSWTRSGQKAAAVWRCFSSEGPNGECRRVTEAETWARRALRLDPRSSRAWAVLSFAEQSRVGGVTAPARVRPESRFVRRTGYSPRAMLGATVMGRSCGLAIEAFNEASRVDPLLQCLGERGHTARPARPAGRGVALNEQVLRLEPDAPTALSNQAGGSPIQAAPGRLEILKGWKPWPQRAASAAMGRAGADRAAIEGSRPLPETPSSGCWRSRVGPRASTPGRATP